MNTKKKNLKLNIIHHEEYEVIIMFKVSLKCPERNIGINSIGKIRRFVNLYKVFDADDEELTRTSKLRRSFVEKRYRDIVNALYSESDTVHMDTTITYEDGREQRIKTNLHIQKVESGG